jgi:hypothetical protein
VGLLIVYLILMIVGDVLGWLIGLVIEHYWPAASLPTFLFLYFFFLWVAWVIAVRVTAPRTAPQPAPAP